LGVLTLHGGARILGFSRIRVKYANEEPNHTTPIQIALNCILQSQTMACIAKSSCEISPVLRYYAALRGNSVPTLSDNLPVPPSRAKKSKRENRS